mgnify:CR=1 FL=1
MSTKINNQKDFTNLCKSITTDDLVAFDLEFMNNKTFYPILCLIQINISDKQTYIIDPFFDGFSIKPFAKILQNKKIKKILHSSFQDFVVLYKETKIKPKSVFDTQMMANFLGFDFNISYCNLVKSFLGEELSKELQRSNWKNRPLSDMQLEYAAIDVKYLVKIYKIMEDRLVESGKLKYCIKEANEFSKRKEYDLEKQDPCKKFSFVNKSIQYEKNIKALVKWRDEIARDKNIPRSFILNNVNLDKISKSNIEKIESLEKVVKINQIKIGAGNKDKIFEILKKNRLSPEKGRKIKNIANKIEKKHKKIYQKTQELLIKASKDSNIAPELIARSSDLRNIILENTSVKSVLKGWRYKLFGKDLKIFLKKFSC